MKQGLIAFLMCAIGFCSFGQKVTLNPTITPVLFQPGTSITIVYDVTNTSLANLANAYAWVWIPGATINAKYNVNPASTNIALSDNTKFTKSVVAGKTLFTLIFTPSDFFAEDISSQTEMGILLKGNDWSNGQTTDYIANFGFKINLESPANPVVFTNTSEAINIHGTTTVPADFELFVNDVSVNIQTAVTNYTYLHTVTETSGYVIVKLKGSTTSGTDEVSFEYVISENSPPVVRPAGIVSGINYHPSDNTKVTLCLLAPGKSSVYALGDFLSDDSDDWLVLPENIMKRDGEYFWIELTGLTPGEEYAFQYLVDETVYLTDPYSDKILDGQNDQYIPSNTYPSLKAFPEKARSDKWYFNKVSVLQTNQAPYEWQVTNFEKPVKENLVIYELLVRDFFGDGQRNYQNLIDTISYLKRLGVSAIELMPMMEFSGNDSWGYNPNAMFAPDKYYGTKNKFKEFVDVCHQNGIAVILDIAMNQQDLPNAYLMMDFDFATFKPTVNNKWFNVKATHPYNVFYDLNHESSYTKAYLDTINHYWLNEFKVDGYRFDLSKGFSSVNYCTTANCDSGPEVSAWSSYDASRIAILKRMADKIWEHTPNAYIILEHFAANAEEKELAQYRVDEGKGMMLWGNLNYAYSQNTKGYSTDSDISWISHTTRGWSAPHVVGYMESHDEERVMYRNLTEGNSSISYNVKSLNTALARIEAASTIFYTIPGPKMLWQFGELGYDIPINENGRTGAKPVKWEYQQDPNRNKLYEHISDLNRLRNTYSIFTNGTPAFAGMSSLFKQLTLKNNPYTTTPTNTDEMNAVVAVNFGVASDFLTVTFPHTGTWYDYYDDGSSLSVTNVSQSIVFEPGQYRIYTDVFLPESHTVTALEPDFNLAVDVFPNPTQGKFSIKRENAKMVELKILDVRGVEQQYQQDGDLVDITNLPSGLYILKISDKQNRHSVQKLIKK